MTESANVLPLRLVDDPDEIARLTALVPLDDEPDEDEYLSGEIVDWDGEDDEDQPPHPVVEHAAYVLEGVRFTLEQRHAARVGAVYEERADRALTEADHATAQEWSRIGQAERERREARKQERRQAFWDFYDAAPRRAKIGGVAYAAACALWAGAQQDVAAFFAPTRGILNGIGETGHLVSAYGEPTILTCLGAGFAYVGWRAWLVGRANAAHSPLPWVAALAAPDHDDTEITPSTVVVAFRDLGLATLRKAIEAMPDGGAQMLSPIRFAGCGVQVDVKLPTGVSTEHIQKRRRQLAENLGRHEHELFITVPEQARTVRLWIADSGALDERIGPSPLVWDTSIVADYYTGRAPWGQTLRGDDALVSLFQQHILITGKSNQGKTASLRALILWLAHDPTVELQIADLKGVGDWAMFDGIATVLHQGPTDQHCIAATLMLEDLVEEMNRRLVALEQSGSPDGVTRDMARAPGSGFHPIVAVVDEAQKAYMCMAVGDDGRPYGGKKHNARYFKAVREIKNQGRAVNITLAEGTQDPTDDNLPKISREASHLRLALYLATESQAKMALGEAPVEQGAAPHKLRDGLDRGTVVSHGPGIDIPKGEPAVTIRTHFISGAEAAEVADRIRAMRGALSTTTSREIEAETRNLLADVEVVLRDHDDRIRLTHLVGLLAKAHPGYEPYEEMTGRVLARRLESFGVRVTNAKNVLRLDPRDFREVFSRLATNEVR